MELVKAAQRLDEITKDINQAIVEGAKKFLLIGKLLKIVKDGGLWQTSEALSFADWCEKGVRLRKSQSYNAISVYEKWGPIIENDPSLGCVEPTKLIRLLPYANTDEQAEDLIHYAVENDARAFEDTIRSLRGNRCHDECLCPEEFQDDYTKCQLCGKFHRITPEAPLEAQDDTKVRYTVQT